MPKFFLYPIKRMALLSNTSQANPDIDLLYDESKDFGSHSLQFAENDDADDEYDDTNLPQNLNQLHDADDIDQDSHKKQEQHTHDHDEETINHEENDKNDAGSVSSYVGSDLTPEEILKKKKTLLYKLKRFQKKGFTLSRAYNLESNLIDMKAEEESIRREANLGATVATMKKGLTISTYLLEMLNHQFDPINAKLDRWSEQVKEDIDHGDYDEVCEELYDKYSNRLDMPPEVKLMSMLATSALQYHVAQVVVNRTLDTHQTDQILRENPQIKKDIINAANSSNVTSQLNKQMKMKDPTDIDDILQELQIEDENSKILSTNF